MALQLPSMPVIPKPDHSWLKNLAGNIGAIDDVRADRIIRDDLTRNGIATKQPGGFLNSLLNGNSRQGQFPAAPTPMGQGAPEVAPRVQRADLQGDTLRPFIDTVRGGGLTNPYALSAVAATGRAESGWSAKNANSTWSDPSESGQAGTAGGIMSWRGPRYQALAATCDLSPEGQARFFLQENPELIQKLNNASSVQEAQQLMNNAWKFAGYDRQGGESARRIALANAYYKNEFSNAQTNGGAAAIKAIAPLEQGDTAPQATAYRDPMVSAPNSRVAAPAQAETDPAAMRYTMSSPTAPQQNRAPMQIADASNRFVAQPQSQSAVPVDGDLIRRMVQNPITRERGLALWQQATEGRKMGYDFMLAPNGDLLRTDNQGGASVVGNFGKTERQGLVNAGNGQLYDPNIQQWISSQNGGQQFRQATPEEANRYGSQAGQFGPDGKFYPINPPQGTSLQVDPTTGAVTFNQGAGVKPLTEGQSKDTVYSTRATAAMPLLNKHEGALLSLGETLASGVPMNLGNYAQSEEFQLARDAGKDFLASILRKDTGAAVTKSEEDLYGRTFLPQLGDKPATVDAKRQRRSLAVEAIKAGMPPQAIANMGRALESVPTLDAGEPPPSPPESPVPPAPRQAPGGSGPYPRARNQNTGAIIERERPVNCFC